MKSVYNVLTVCKRELRAYFESPVAYVFMVVFLLGKMAGGEQHRWVDLTIQLVGNVFIIGLEGLVVTIQSLRLNFYEFFGKFFRATGTPFRPASLREEG